MKSHQLAIGHVSKQLPSQLTGVLDQLYLKAHEELTKTPVSPLKVNDGSIKLTTLCGPTFTQTQATHTSGLYVTLTRIDEKTIQLQIGKLLAKEYGEDTQNSIFFFPK